jgi:hypothetical protein
MYANPRKAWEKGYHRQGLLRLFGDGKDREAKDGEPTEEDVAEVRRRAMLGLVIGLVLSPLIVAVAMLIGCAKHESRFGGGMQSRPAVDRIWRRTLVVESHRRGRAALVAVRRGRGW